VLVHAGVAREAAQAAGGSFGVVELDDLVGVERDLVGVGRVRRDRGQRQGYGEDE
jgi:hypothetical protein